VTAAARARAGLALVSLAVLATVLTGPIAAFAAPSKSAPVAYGTLDAEVWPDPSGSTAVLVGLAVPESVKLPVTARLPLPPGAEVVWAGEILGSAAAQDIERTYKIGTGAGGGTYVEFTLERSHNAQIDTSGFPLTQAEGTFSANVDWIQSVPSSATAFSVRLPSGVTSVSISPKPVGQPESNARGELLYQLGSQKMTPGQKELVAVSFNVSTPSQPKPVEDRTPIVIIVVGVALVLAVAGLGLALRRNSGGS
jgi:hypothetical protein